MEHPCTDCGDSDYHGKFRLVGKRKWQKSSGVQLHFFEVTERKFSFMHLFEPESSRVMTFRKEACCAKGTCSSKTTMGTSSVSETTIDMDMSVTAGKGKIVRSTITCSGICCSSEIPLVNSALEPLDGVEKVMINVPLRNVIIDHDPSIVTAAILEDILNQNDFGATIRRDGGAKQQKQKQTGRGKSRFYVDKICCASEIPMINTIINPMEGTSAVSINVTTKMVRKEIVVARGVLSSLTVT